MKSKKRKPDANGMAERPKRRSKESEQRDEVSPKKKQAFLAEAQEEHGTDGVTQPIRPKRAKLTREEIRRRMDDFPNRRAAFIAAIRKNKD